MKKSNVIHRVTNEIDLPGQNSKEVIMEAQNESEGLLTITMFPEGQPHNAYYVHMETSELLEYINFLKEVHHDLQIQDKEMEVQAEGERKNQ